MTAVNLNRAIRGPVTAVPVVAGKGVRLVADTANNRFVVEADETVLFDGTQTKDPVNSFTLSEYASNFERIRFYGIGYGYTKVMYECQAPNTSSEALSICYTYYCRDTDSNPFQLRMGVYTTSDGLSFSLRQSKFLYATDSGTAFAGGNNTQGPSVYKIIGINRISST